MSSSNTTNNKELRINAQEGAKRSMYFAKELLNSSETIDIVSGTYGAPVATRTAETLIRLGYVKYTSIRTETNVVNGARKTRLVLTVTKTANFQKLYEENAAKRETLLKEKETNNSNTNVTNNKAQEGNTVQKQSNNNTTTSRK